MALPAALCAADSVRTAPATGTATVGCLATAAGRDFDAPTSTGAAALQAACAGGCCSAGGLQRGLRAAAARAGEGGIPLLHLLLSERRCCACCASADRALRCSRSTLKATAALSRSLKMHAPTQSHLQVLPSETLP